MGGDDGNHECLVKWWCCWAGDWSTGHLEFVKSGPRAPKGEEEGEDGEEEEGGEVGGHEGRGVAQAQHKPNHHHTPQPPATSISPTLHHASSSSSSSSSSMV